jgi:hypothetical protein
MKILGSRGFSNSFDRIGSKLIDLYNFATSAEVASLLDHNNLCYLALE